MDPSQPGTGSASKDRAREAAELVEMGEFYFINQKLGEAIKVLKKAIGLDPKSAKAHYNLGIVYEAKNQKEEAKAMFEKTLQLDPGFPGAQQHLDRLIGIGEK